MSETTLTEAPAAAAARLVHPREEALAHLQTQVKRGMEIKAMRIRNGPELDNARAAKLDWTNRTTEMLQAMFDAPAVAEQCNDWVGKIYPEYAEFGNFVEQFYAEMEHRLKRLKAVHKQIQKIPSESRATTPAPAPAAAAPVAPTADVGHVPISSTTPQQILQKLNGLLVVFGADEATTNMVQQFLEELDVDLAVVRDAQANVADALDQSADASFAMIMQGEPQQDRSFELGLCVGRLGMKRVCVLHPPQTNLQPDPRGVSHAILDPAGGWQLQVARHLRCAGLDVDLNRLC